MTVHTRLDDEALEQAALYALRSVPEGEAEAYESHLAACPACSREVRSLQRVVAELGNLAGAVAPPAELRARLIASATCERGRWERGGAGVIASEASGTPAVHEDATEPAASAGQSPRLGQAEPRPVQTWKRWAAERPASPLTLVAAGEAGFEPTGVAGIEVKRLFLDQANDRATMLVRMAAGSAYPAHRHGGPEECLVLEGDLRFGATHMRAGDYVRASEGSVHDVQSTDHGCLLFIVSSLRDELLESRAP